MAQHRAAATGGIVTHVGGRLMGDEDDDDSRAAQTGGLASDNDADYDNDYKQEHKGYLDADDSGISRLGRPATSSQARTLAAVVTRYYMAATTANGVAACALLTPILAGAVPEDYGQQPSTPAQLRGYTCAAVMTKLFEHNHARLAAATEIVATRVLTRNRALVLLGSATTPASSIGLVRERGVWKLDNLFANELP